MNANKWTWGWSVSYYLINKCFQFLWTFSLDHENIVDKSKPQVWLMGWVKESVAFKFTEKQISVGRSHTRAYSTLLVITSILQFQNTFWPVIIPTIICSWFLLKNLKMGVILSGKHVKPTLSTKLRQLSLWALINVINCNYILIVYLLFFCYLVFLK